MKRSEFDHAIRAAGSILGESEILVFGSQAIHGSLTGDLPVEAQRSIEVDIVAFDDTDARKADLIDGSIGQALSYKSSIEFPLMDKQRQSHNEILIQAGKRMKLKANVKPISVFSISV